MKAGLKKSFAVLLICSFSVGLLVPRRSEAFMGGTAIVISMLLGGATAQISLLLGGAVLASAASVAGGIEFINKARNASGGRKAAFWVVAIGALFAGGLILDGSAHAEQDLSLASMDPEKAARLGLTEEEHAAYEAELPLINLINEEAIARVERELANSKPSVQVLAESLNRHWQEIARASLSAESIQAVQKIGASL
jgi:hypothetical protein